MSISPTGWALKGGMIFSGHHDAPVALPDSIRVIDATVIRRARGLGRIVGPEQRVDVITALKAMTLWPAYHHFEEATKGSLEPGAWVDRGAYDITPLLAAFGGHRGPLYDGCAHDAMFRMTAVMATGLAGR